MKEEWKVYIKGVQGRGDEVIKTLEDLGGRNIYSLDGHNNGTYYFITPDGIINNTDPLANSIFSFVKEFYTEIKLPRWKPEYGGQYYYIDIDGHITTYKWYDFQDNVQCYKFGNCFRTKEEAEATRDKIKEILK